MEKVDISMMAYQYVFEMSKYKKYNPQTVSIFKMVKREGKGKILSELNKETKLFCDSNSPYIARDFVYKSDYFTPRNMYLISPLYYIYYTKLVFEIANIYLNNEKSLDFSKKRMKVFYSGHLKFSENQKEITEFSKFNNSYKSFQKEREKYFGNPALKLDLKDFFNSIKTENLIEKLRVNLGENKAIDDLECFLNHCGFQSVPQFHYSIGSSILSQIYLMNFDDKFQKLLIEKRLSLIRFVDDMFIIPDDKLIDKKRNNILLNHINHFLWEDELMLNSSKTKVLSAQDYKKEFQRALEYEGNESSFSSEKIVEEKAKDIIKNGDFFLFLTELNELEKVEGINIVSYKKIADQYISIDGEDTQKVLNNIIFSGKWRNISNKELNNLVDHWAYLLFNPAQFTILYILICRYLENKKIIDGSKIRNLLTYLREKDGFTFHDTLVAVAYLFQNEKKNKDLLTRISLINKKYVEFITEFVE